MEIKKASEPMIDRYQSESESQTSKSDSKSIQSGISSARDSFESGGGEFENHLRMPPTKRWEDLTDLKKGPSNNASGFDGRDAAQEIQDASNNKIPLPPEPIKTYTRKESK
jgi:hypothetical protein